MKNILNLENLHKKLSALSNPSKAGILEHFFKTGPGEYGFGDKFLGIVVPELRKIAREYKVLKLVDLKKLIKSRYHEERMVALLILAVKNAYAGEKERKEIYDFYLNNIRYINNWDLVDLSAEKIIGPYLENKDKKILEKLARSEILWERRIAMLSTFHYIKQGKTVWPLKIAEMLINDKHDLIHKAVGWMLREIGKRCGENILEEFLQKRYQKMPRTMLRYAIERLDEKKRKYYLAR